MAASKIGRYEVEGKIGEGAFGVVYKARDPVLDRAVAIKVPSLTLSDDELANLIMEFYREARIGAQFRHSNIVTVYDLGVNEHSDNLKMHYLVMEYVSGMSLCGQPDMGKNARRSVSRVLSTPDRPLGPDRR